MIERKVTKSVKTKYLAIIAVILLLLAYFGDVTAAPSDGITQQAEFTKEANFGNCEAGLLNWDNSGKGLLNKKRSVYIVNCKNSTNIQYPEGKTMRNITIIHQKKTEALNKLTEEDKRLLGLTK